MKFECVRKRSRVMYFGFKGQTTSAKGRGVQLLITMLGSTLSCLLFAGLCLGDSYNLPEDQAFFEGKGSPVLRRFNISSPIQLEKVLHKAQVRPSYSEHIRYPYDKLCLRTMASISGKPLQLTSIFTSLPIPLHHPSSYPLRTSPCSTSIPLKLPI